MAKMNLAPGTRFNTRTVISEAGQNKFKQSLYIARCDCGHEQVYTGSYLKEQRPCSYCYVKPAKPKPERKKTSISSKRKNPLDFIGEKFCMLTLLSITDKRHDSKQIGIFKCDCGKEVELMTSRVLCGKISHCGCLAPDKVGSGKRARPNMEAVLKKRIEELVGKTYGYLTFKEFAYSKNNKRYFNMECVCGNIKALPSTNVLTGLTRSCGCKKGELVAMKRRNTHIGERYNWLTITRFSHESSGCTYFYCLCDCGKEVVNSSSDLKLERIKSCGCKRAELLRNLRKLPDNMGSINVLYGQYSSRAKKTEREFNLTKEQFIDLIGGNCYYCDAPPSNKYRHRAYLEDSFMYNGLDRLDSSLGYTSENVVSCCSTCNTAKLEQSPEAFKNWIKRIFIHHIVRDKVKDQQLIAGLLEEIFSL